MLRQAFSARRGIFSMTYRPRHSQIQRSLTTGQHRAFHIFPGLRYNDYSSPYDMTSGIRSSLSTTSRNSSSRGILSTTESEAEMNDIKTKLQDLERRLDRETESRQHDTEFNLSLLTFARKDISRLYKSQTELRKDTSMKEDFWYRHWCLYFGVITALALYFGVLCARSLAECNEEMARINRTVRRESTQPERTLEVEH